MIKKSLIIALIAITNISCLTFGWESPHSNGNTDDNGYNNSWDYDYDDGYNTYTNNNYINNGGTYYNNSSNYITNGCNMASLGYYVYDYDKDYYEAMRYLNYNLSSCYYNNGIKYCQASFSEYNYGMSTKYDCSYNQQYKSQYCKYPFEKTRRFIGQNAWNNSSYYTLDNGRYVTLQNCQYYTIPQNSYRVNNGRQCNSGYYKNGNYCETSSNYSTYNYSNSNCSWGYSRVGNSCQKIYLPNNAHLTSNGNDWECNSGYYRNGNSCSYSYNQSLYNNCSWGYKNVNGSCQKIYLPKNAQLTSDGTDWICNSGYYKSNGSCVYSYNYVDTSSTTTCDWGYRKTGNGCEKLYIPSNAHRTNNGSDWTCDSGYYRNGNYCQLSNYTSTTTNCGWGYRNESGYCQKIYLPDNAHLTADGNEWQCNSGYYRSGNYCYTDDGGCGNDYNPVCGNNSVTYNNSCLARNAGVTVLYSGLCRIY